MIKVLEEAASPVVSYLHGNHALSPSYTFSSLTMDVTRFLLMQHEKQSDRSNTGAYSFTFFLTPILMYYMQIFVVLY